MKKFFKTFILTRWMFPYSCHKCGRDYKPMRFDDLSPESQKKYTEADITWVFLKAMPPFTNVYYPCECLPLDDRMGKLVIIM